MNNKTAILFVSLLVNIRERMTYFRRTISFSRMQFPSYDLFIVLRLL